MNLSALIDCRMLVVIFGYNLWLHPGMYWNTRDLSTSCAISSSSSLASGLAWWFCTGGTARRLSTSFTTSSSFLMHWLTLTMESTVQFAPIPSTNLLSCLFRCSMWKSTGTLHPSFPLVLTKRLHFSCVANSGVDRSSDDNALKNENFLWHTCYALC